MEKHTGTITYFLSRDEESAVTAFFLQGVVCIGTMQELPLYTPVMLYGSWSGDEKFYFDTYVLGGGKSFENVQFLNSAITDVGIGKKRSELIVDKVGDPFFCDDLREKLKGIKGVTAKAAKKIDDTIREMKGKSRLLGYLKASGCRWSAYRMMEELYAKYKDKAIDKIGEDPYELRCPEISYATCETLAATKGMDGNDPYRLAALISECLQRQQQCGHTYLTIPELFTWAARIEKEAGAYYRTDYTILLQQAKGSAGLRWYTCGNEDRIYAISMYLAEQESSAIIRRMRKNAISFPWRKTLATETEFALGVDYSEEQRRAFNLLKTSGIGLLTGGPGTGKTTVLRGFIHAFRNMYPDEMIALCAPTGKAAARMQEMTGEIAMTVHSLLEYQPLAGVMGPRRNEYLPLEHKLVIVDEASMMDSMLFYYLIRSLRYDALLLLIGDEDQLPPVCAGFPFKQLLACPDVPHVRLTRNFRQEEGSVLYENIAKIRIGKSDFACDQGFEIIQVNSEEEMRLMAISAVKYYYSASEPQRVKLLSPLRKSEVLGLNRLNAELKDQLNFDADHRYSVGDPVILTRNRPDQGYINGDQGIITSMEGIGKSRTVTVRLEHREVKLEHDLLSDLQLGYALTVHQAQGAECPIAVTIIPSEPKGFISRNLLYVAVSRATMKNILIVQPGALDQAVQNICPMQRRTSLLEMLEDDILHRSA